MKKPLLTLVTTITTLATGTSLALATLSNPTEIQKELSNTANAIAIAGTTAIFGLLARSLEQQQFLGCLMMKMETIAGSVTF